TNKLISVTERKRRGISLASFRCHPRGGAQSAQWEEMLKLLNTVHLSSMADRWAWTLHGMGSFTVSSAQVFIDNKYLITGGEPTSWYNLILIKINVMAWRLSLDKLPTRLNLDARSIDVPTVLCPICGEHSENVSHLFFSCSFVSQVYVLIAQWWDLDVSRLNSYIQWSDWFFNIRMKRMQKQNFQALFYSLWWHVWAHRNDCVFGVVSPRKSTFFDNFVRSLLFGSIVGVDLQTLIG
ncbi:RNA-directed DNA polymerase, eukaryota, partial [Tanacetum coccineum]